MTNNIMEEHFQESFGIPDWKLREIPTMHIEMWTELMDLVGPEHVKVISGSRRQVKSGGLTQEMVRATVMMSPTAMERLNEFIESQPKA